MSLYNFTIIILFLSLPLSTYSQRMGAIQIDTSDCGEEYNNLKLRDKVPIEALNGAELYIKSIVGKQTLQNNIRLEYCAISECSIGIYSNDIRQPKRLGFDTCYELPYMVMERGDTIGYFSLLFDRYGNPVKPEYETDNQFNCPQLIRGIKKHFDREFNLSFTQAVAIGKEKGLFVKPVLKCEVDNKFLQTNTKEVYAKIKYYWLFHQFWDGGHEAILEVNAETGKIEKEIYIPRMPG